MRLSVTLFEDIERGYRVQLHKIVLNRAGQNELQYETLWKTSLAFTGPKENCHSLAIQEAMQQLQHITQRDPQLISLFDRAYDFYPLGYSIVTELNFVSIRGMFMHRNRVRGKLISSPSKCSHVLPVLPLTP